MHVITVDNVNEALAAGLEYLYAEGIEEPSRNGPVIVASGPVTTVYKKPWQRVLFSPLRDANPFFHLFEALWMIAGRNDIEFPAFFAKQMREYSDDGKTQRGAYGHRWRKWFGYDQLQVIAEELKRDPNSRRCVLGMWDAGNKAYVNLLEGEEGELLMNSDSFGDLLCTSKDKPCNTHIYLDCRGGKLNITVCCRSNDIWWGAYGANAVHFSVLQEYMAAWIGVPIGEYRQMSNNYHIYTAVVPREKFLVYAEDALKSDLYKLWGLSSTCPQWPLMQLNETIEMFTHEIQCITDIQNRHFNIQCEFLRKTVMKMWATWISRKHKLVGGELGWINAIEAADWHKACLDWYERREARKEKALA